MKSSKHQIMYENLSSEVRKILADYHDNIEKLYDCEICNKDSMNFRLYYIHLVSKQHTRNLLLNEGKLNKNKFYCEPCNIRCASKSAYEVHCNREKHKIKCNVE